VDVAAMATRVMAEYRILSRRVGTLRMLVLLRYLTQTIVMMVMYKRKAVELGKKKNGETMLDC
jgi:hypothetical protein